MNLIAKLNEYDPNWRDNVASDPIEAGVELGILEADALDDEEYAELDFEPERS